MVCLCLLEIIQLVNFYFFFCIIFLMCFLNQASDEPFSVDAKEIDRRIEKRIDGDLLYLNGASFLSSATMNKMVLTT